MFWYIVYCVGGLLLVATAVVLFLMYKGYSKIKPKPFEGAQLQKEPIFASKIIFTLVLGVPIPPFTHTLLGHPDKMLSPLKHELRLEVTESFKGPYHQLVMMKHSSIFVNDAEDIAKLFLSMPSKGGMYDVFRYNKAIPDMLASDGQAWETISSNLRPSLVNVTVTASDIEPVLAQLDSKLKDLSESGQSANLVEFMTLLGLDIVCYIIFKYELNALSGSEEGKQLYRCLKTLTEFQSSQGIYADPKIRKIPQSEIKEVTTDWRVFLTKLVQIIKTEAEAYKSKHGELDHLHNFGHALIKYGEEDAAFTELEMLCEVHQVLRHGHECLAGTLIWSFYALFKNPKVRATLERELAVPLQTSPDYMECFIREVMRRYPTAGNMTVRTVDSETFSLSRGHKVPVGTPVHLPMWSSHNTTREWSNPREFLPERWAATTHEEGHNDTEDAEEKKASSFPACPFMNKLPSSYTPCDVDPIYEGAGFDDGTLCYFPFSAGYRSCPAKRFMLQSLRIVLSKIVLAYRIDPSEVFWEQDPGQSSNAIIIPLFQPAVTVRVERVVNLGKIQIKRDEGWADDDDNDANDSSTIAVLGDGESAHVEAAVTVPRTTESPAGSENSEDYEKIEHADSVSTKH